MTDTATETPTNTQKYYPKTIKAIQMVQAGIDPADALKMVNFKDNISAKQVSVLRGKVKRYGLTAPSVVRPAHEQIKRILHGQPRETDRRMVTKDGQVVDYKDNIYPSDSAIIEVSKMVYDRYEAIDRGAAGSGAGISIDKCVMLLNGGSK